jgi:hypothetical protein
MTCTCHRILQMGRTFNMDRRDWARKIVVVNYEKTTRKTRHVEGCGAYIKFD